MILRQTQCDQIWPNFSTFGKICESLGQFLRFTKVVFRKILNLLWQKYVIGKILIATNGQILFATNGRILKNKSGRTCL